MRGLDGVRKAKLDDDTVILTVDAKKLVSPSQIRKALPEKYAMGKVRVADLTGTVDKKDGKYIIKVRGCEAAVGLREGELRDEKAVHPMWRLKRLFDDGVSTFVVGGALVEEKDEKTENVTLALEVTSAELPRDGKKK